MQIHFLVISAVVGGWWRLSRDFEACVAESVADCSALDAISASMSPSLVIVTLYHWSVSTSVSSQYCHSVILIILLTAAGAGNDRSHMVLHGECWAVQLIVLHIYKLVHRRSSSSSNFMFMRTMCTLPQHTFSHTFLPLMPALCSMLKPTYYAQN